MLAAAHDLVSTKHGLSEAEAKDLQPGDVINIAVCSEYLLLEQLDTRSVSGALIGNRTVNRNLDTPQQSSTGPGVPGPVGLKQLQFDSVRQASVMDHARAWRLVTEPKKKRPQGGVANPLA